MGNTFGQLFRVTTFGESHGGGVGVVIDGCPPNVELSKAEIQSELDRRRPGQSKITTQRKEEDQCEILSGVFEGKTLGTPIAILVRNKDARPEDYFDIAEKFRPSHADFTYEAKYGIRNWQGGGRASARETIGRVAAGAVAKKILSLLHAEFEIVAYVAQIHGVVANIDRSAVKTKDVEKNILRCPDTAAVPTQTSGSGSRPSLRRHGRARAWSTATPSRFAAKARPRSRSSARRTPASRRSSRPSRASRSRPATTRSRPLGPSQR